MSDRRRGMEAPRLDPRRTADFAAELRARARAWIPDWGLADAEGDFGRALLDVAARFNSEVAERLDGAGDKMRRGFLDWLGVRGEAARPSRMPVVFKLADAAHTPVLAEPPVRLQVDAGGTPVVFETERAIRIVPGQVEALVAVDVANDAYYRSPTDLTTLQPVEPAPTRWQPRSFVAAGSTTIQLDPEGGLGEGTVVEAAGHQYRVLAADKGLVTITPPLDTELSPETVVTKADRFAPFEGVARNWQAHALYLGDAELLNIEAAATIEVLGATALRSGVTWQYWGKADGSDVVAWQPLELAAGQLAGGGVLLEKRKGAVEITEIAGRSGRWIRAYRQKSEAVISSNAFTIRINSAGCDDPIACPNDGTSVPPAAEGMANTTPLVLENVFFPLGREPRQFDAFYLGSKEVFSKPQATVALCFTMAEPKFKTLGALRGGFFSDLIFAGVGEDGHLHLLVLDPSGPRLTRIPNRPPMRPPSPDQAGAPVGGTPIALDQAATSRPAMWLVANSVGYIAVTAKNQVWIWRESGAQSGWRGLPGVGPDPADREAITGLVHLANGTNGYLLALRDRQLYAIDLDAAGAAWQEVSVKAGTTDIALTQIAGIQVEAQSRQSSFAEGLVGISETGRLYGITLSAGSSGPIGAATRLLNDVRPDVSPAAIRRTDNRLIAVAVGTQAAGTVRAFRSTGAPNSFALDESDEAEIEWPLLGASVDLNIVGGDVTAAFSLRAPGGDSALALWSPRFGSDDTPLFRTRIPSAAGAASGAPTLLPRHVMVPTESSEIALAPVDLGRRTPRIALLGTVLVAEAAADRLVGGDLIAFFESGTATLPRLEPVTSEGIEFRGKVYHSFSTPAARADRLVYKAATQPRTGQTRASLDELRLAGGDGDIQSGTFLLITTDRPPALYKVIQPVVNNVATLDRDLEFNTPPAVGDSVLYRPPDPSGIALRPMLALNPPGSWEARILDRTQLLFPGADPSFQSGEAFDSDGTHPRAVALGRFWIGLPPPTSVPNGATYIVDESVGDWSRQLADTSTNPELSWEYWNGTGWWTLGHVPDTTLNLKRSGQVTFTVPRDLRESDWSGKTNFWIRARLIGGDYGQEKVTVLTTPKGDGKTEQTVQRSSEGIRAPSVLKLVIAYRLCEGTLPTFVLTEDSGSLRDQSDANRTPGAVVDSFVPLSVTLGGLGQTSETSSTTTITPGDCGCTAERVATPSTLAANPGSLALLVGTKGRLEGEPVNLLLLVDERRHTEQAPMAVDALIADRFERVVADDETRAAGESGVIAMSFPTAPTERELFGRSLSWLRLSPRSVAANAAWKPAIRGAYLNAAWASATETLTRELLGSSDGAPFLTFRLARPPVLRGTLELRVREPLGEEERTALTEHDRGKVVSDVEGLDGHWVRWERVTDPGDEPPDARVYGLDESTGEIRFGDGLHGMIPPIGRDSIVAFSYKRTEAGTLDGDVLAANSIAPRTPLNLVTPVESVEAVTAADRAAGGSPPESVERVVRFGFSRLRHRSRVVTERDVEEIALQASPNIAQARAFRSRTGIKLVIVMKGADPAPGAAQVRELRRVLLEASPATLAEPGALQIVGPTLRRLQVALTLRVESLDLAGRVAQRVKERLRGFFDVAGGGRDEQGWPLGVNPSEDDVALALADTEHLESVLDVRLREAGEDETTRPWPETLAATHIAALAEDPVRIEFETAEVNA